MVILYLRLTNLKDHRIYTRISVHSTIPTNNKSHHDFQHMIDLIQTTIAYLLY